MDVKAITGIVLMMLQNVNHLRSTKSWKRSNKTDNNRRELERPLFHREAFVALNLISSECSTPLWRLSIKKRHCFCYCNSPCMQAQSCRFKHERSVCHSSGLWRIDGYAVGQP